MDLKTLVFDLDDTLLDTSKILIPIAKSRSFFEVIQKPLPLMDGAESNLKLLSKKYLLALVTLGDVEVQKQKVKSLNISHFFQRIEYVDEHKHETKKFYFEKIVSDLKIKPSQLLSIGNRRSLEIRQAKQIGSWTCLFKHGEHVNEKPLVPEDNPDFEINHHRDLVSTCSL